MKLKPIFLALIFPAALGCVNRFDLAGNPASPYHRLEVSMTREARFMGIEKVRYMTTITYKSRKLREAYVEEYAKRYELTQEKKAEMLRKELEEAARYDVFLVSHYATDKDVAKVSENSNQVWRLTLVRDQASVPAEPESVFSTPPNNTVLHYFYPQIMQWSNVYIVKFKREREAHNLELRMAGVVDQLSFRWPGE